MFRGILINYWLWLSRLLQGDKWQEPKQIRRSKAKPILKVDKASKKKKEERAQHISKLQGTSLLQQLQQCNLPPAAVTVQCFPQHPAPVHSFTRAMALHCCSGTPETCSFYRRRSEASNISKSYFFTTTIPISVLEISVNFNILSLPWLSQPCTKYSC